MKNKIMTAVALSVMAMAFIGLVAITDSDADFTVSDSSLKGQGVTSQLTGAPTVEVYAEYHVDGTQHALIMDAPGMNYPMNVKVVLMSYDPSASSPIFTTVYESDGRLPQSGTVLALLGQPLSQTSDTLRYEAYVYDYQGTNVLAQATLLVEQYRVAFDKGDGEGSFAEQILDYGETPVLPTAGTFYKDYHVLSHYSTTAGGSAVTMTAFDKDTLLYAVYAPEQYEVIFEGNIPDAVSGPAQSMPSMTLTYGEEASLSANTFVASGYTFLGWATESSATTALYTDGERVTNICGSTGSNPVAPADVTLYAVWEVNSFNLIYNGNRPSAATSDVTGVYAGITSVTSYSSVSIQSAPELIGWTFQGWNTKSDGSGDDYTAGSATSELSGEDGSVVTLYAKWTKNGYTIDYDVNIPTGANTPDPLPTVSSTAAEYDSDVTLSSVSYSVPGWTFIGWNTSAGGTGSGYAPGSNGKLNLVATDGGSITLYAMYTAEVYQITVKKAVDSDPLSFAYPAAASGSGSTKVIIYVTSTDLNVYFEATVTGAYFEDGSTTNTSHDGIFIIRSITGPVTVTVSQKSDSTSSGGSAGRFAITSIKNTDSGNEVSLYIDAQSSGLLPYGNVSLKGVYFDTIVFSDFSTFIYGNLTDAELATADWSVIYTFPGGSEQNEFTDRSTLGVGGMRTCDAVMKPDVNIYSARAFFTPTGSTDPTDSTAWTLWNID